MTDTEKQIGVIYPSDGVLDHEFFCCVPPGVSAHFTRSLSSAQTDSSLPESTRHTHMAKTSDLDETARTFSFIDAGTIAYTCTIASFTRGVGFDLDIAGHIETGSGSPATTSSTAAMAAPYQDDGCERLRTFISDRGVDVVSLKTLDLRGMDRRRRRGP